MIGLGAVLNPGPVGTDVGTSLIFGFGCVTGAAMAQAGLIRYRSDRTRLYLIKSGPQGTGQPLPSSAPGQPRRFDFWVMLVLALIVLAFCYTPEHGQYITEKNTLAGSWGPSVPVRGDSRSGSSAVRTHSGQARIIT